MSISRGGSSRPGEPSANHTCEAEANEVGDDDDPIANHAREINMLATDVEADLGAGLATP